jgi:hypothetical protein
MRIKVWAYPGVETPLTPDEPDVLDGGDGKGALYGEELAAIIRRNEFQQHD